MPRGVLHALSRDLWRIAWLHSLFGNAPAVATGVSAAMRSRASLRSASSPAGRRRNVDTFGCCRDVRAQRRRALHLLHNEGYMNTGVQRSAATPPAARTATTDAVGPEPGNAFDRQGLPRLADGPRHRLVAPPGGRPARPRRRWSARCSSAAPATSHPRPVPARMGSASDDTIPHRPGSAKETGLLPPFFSRRSTARHVGLAHPRELPSRSYLFDPARYATVGKKPRTGVSGASRRSPTGTSNDTGSSPTKPSVRPGKVTAWMTEPLRITFGTSLEPRDTRARGESSAGLRGPPPHATTPAPRGENIQGVALEASRATTKPPEKLVEEEPAARHSWAGSASIRARRVQPRPGRRGKVA